MATPKRKDDNDSTAEHERSTKRPRTHYTSFRAARPRRPETVMTSAQNSSADPQPSATKRTRSGFRVARPRVPESITSPVSSSISSSSRVTTLAVGPTGRRKGKHKDRNHTPAVADIPSPATLLEDASCNDDQPPNEPTLQDEPSPTPVIHTKPKRSRNNIAKVCGDWESSDMILIHFGIKAKLLEWLSIQDTTLDEILRHDGLGDFLGRQNCVLCDKEIGRFKCKDCSGGCQLRCSACIVKCHQNVPLHRIEVSRFVTATEKKCLWIYFLSNGLGSFSIRILSKILDFVYNSDMVDVLALVRLPGLQLSWSSTLLAYIPLTSTTATVRRMTRSIEEHNYCNRDGFQRHSRGPTPFLHLTALIHSTNIPCKERVISTTSITICYGKLIMPIYRRPL